MSYYTDWREKQTHAIVREEIEVHEALPGEPARELPRDTPGSQPWEYARECASPLEQDTRLW